MKHILGRCTGRAGKCGPIAALAALAAAAAATAGQVDPVRAKTFTQVAVDGAGTAEDPQDDPIAAESFSQVLAPDAKWFSSATADSLGNVETGVKVDPVSSFTLTEITPSPPPVPEPATASMLLLAGALGASRRVRRRR
jgi:hypothetical protein